MTFEQLSTLIKNGYTESQIKELYTIFNAPEDKPQTKTDPPTITNPAPQPKETKTDTNTETGTNTNTGTNTETGTNTKTENPPQESETVALLKEMLGLVRKGNINTMQNETKTQETADQILAKVLNP